MQVDNSEKKEKSGGTTTKYGESGPGILRRKNCLLLGQVGGSGAEAKWNLSRQHGQVSGIGAEP